MNEQDIAKAGKAELRALCKAHGVSYSKLDNAKMRAALRAHIKPDEYVRERMSDTPVIKIIKKVTAPSVLDLLKLIPVGDTFSCKEVAQRTGSTEATVRTIIGNCNSTSDSNKRFRATGLRFATKRGEDSVKRTK